MTKMAANSLEGKAEPFLRRIENLNDDIAAKKQACADECKEVREDVKLVLEEAKEAGITPASLKALVKHREMERKQRKLADKLDIDERAAFEHLVEALGELGLVAAKAAGHTPEQAAAH